MIDGSPTFPSQDSLRQQPVQEQFTGGITPYLPLDGQDISMPQSAGLFSDAGFPTDSHWPFNDGVNSGRNSLVEQLSPTALVRLGLSRDVLPPSFLMHSRILMNPAALFRYLEILTTPSSHFYM